MTSNSAYIYDLHNVYKNWLNELALSNDELGIFKTNLEKIVLANNQIEVTARIEQFQNQFITHLNELQLLRHDIKAAENEIEKNIAENPVAADHRKLDVDNTLEDRMQQFKKLFLELKNDYTAFLAKTL
ncbi:MAG: hypothetical protein KBE91_09340 [Bacteroidia bacterium]|nr:hypothetical protein [Bacteroidia bacterium]